MLIENLGKHLGDGLDAESAYWAAPKALGAELEEECQRLLDLGRRIRTRDLRESSIAKLIEKHVGIKCVMAAEGENFPNAYAIRPTLTTDHVALIEKEHKEMMRVFADGTDKPRNPIFGWVDNKNGRVGGGFSDIQHIVGLDIGFFNFAAPLDFTAKEITSVLLHEVGHLFYFYSALTWVLSTNYYMDYVAKAVFEIKNEEQRIAYLTKAQINRGDIKLIDEVAKAKSLSEIHCILYKENLDNTNSALGNNIYDYRGWEFLADKYATRAGYGSYLSSTMTRMEDAFGTETTKVATWQKILGMFLGAYVSLIFSPLLLLALALVDFQVDIYDKPRKRVETMRKQIIEMLKESGSKEEQQIFLKQINSIDYDLSKYNPEERIFLEWLQSTMGVFGGRAKYRTLTTQKFLEHFANSELRVAALRLQD